MRTVTSAGSNGAATKGGGKAQAAGKKRKGRPGKDEEFGITRCEFAVKQGPAHSSLSVSMLATLWVKTGSSPRGPKLSWQEAHLACFTQAAAVFYYWGVQYAHAEGAFHELGVPRHLPDAQPAFRAVLTEHS